MKKVSQLSPLAPPDMGAGLLDPMGGGGMPMGDPMGAPMGGQMGQMGTMQASSEPKKKYEGFKNPEDIFEDYGLPKALADQKSFDEMVEDIWDLYGGNDVGTDADPDKTGEWPEEQPEGMDEKEVEVHYHNTEKQRWRRLLEDTTIMDIFPKGQDEIKRLISGYATSLGLTKKQQAAASKKPSWYKLAHGSE